VRYKQLGIGVVTILLCFHQIVQAQNDVSTRIGIHDDDVVAAKEGTFSGEGELGITNTSGNTETQNVIARLGIEYHKFSWIHQAHLEMLRSETENETTAERYEALLESDYFLSKINYLFTELRYEDDRFTGYDYQGVLAVGYGRKLINTNNTQLKLTGAVGIKQYQLETADEAERGGVAILGLKYSHKIEPYSEFFQILRAEIASDNSYGKSETGFKVNFMENLALKLSLSITHNTDVPSDVKNTDTISAVTLVYGF
jgi:putative salt-induced outer membrane protein